MSDRPEWYVSSKEVRDETREATGSGLFPSSRERDSAGSADASACANGLAYRHGPSGACEEPSHYLWLVGGVVYRGTGGCIFFPRLPLDLPPRTEGGGAALGV